MESLAVLFPVPVIAVSPLTTSSIRMDLPRPVETVNPSTSAVACRLAGRLRDLRPAVGQGWRMLEVVDDVRITTGEGHAAWSELFNEMFMQKGA